MEAVSCHIGSPPAVDCAQSGSNLILIIVRFGARLKMTQFLRRSARHAQGDYRFDPKGSAC